MISATTAWEQTIHQRCTCECISLPLPGPSLLYAPSPSLHSLPTHSILSLCSFPSLLHLFFIPSPLSAFCSPYLLHPLCSPSLLLPAFSSQPSTPSPSSAPSPLLFCLCAPPCSLPLSISAASPIPSPLRLCCLSIPFPSPLPPITQLKEVRRRVVERIGRDYWLLRGCQRVSLQISLSDCGGGAWVMIGADGREWLIAKDLRSIVGERVVMLRHMRPVIGSANKRGLSTSAALLSRCEMNRQTSDRLLFI